MRSIFGAAAETRAGLRAFVSVRLRFNCCYVSRFSVFAIGCSNLFVFVYKAVSYYVIMPIMVPLAVRTTAVK